LPGLPRALARELDFLALAETEPPKGSWGRARIEGRTEVCCV
jgi:hypothetical protein